MKQKGEGWVEFGEDLKTLAYLDLAEEAREHLALNQYLTQLSNPQVAFAVKQTKPTKVDEAVRVTLEMESYSKPVPSGIAQISEEVEEDAGAVAATIVQRPSDLKLILERMEQMETQLKELQQPTSRAPSRGRGQKKVGSRNYWNCGGEGHLTRDCPSPKMPNSLQGNEEPPVL